MCVCCGSGGKGETRSGSATTPLHRATRGLLSLLGAVSPGSFMPLFVSQRRSVTCQAPDCQSRIRRREVAAVGGGVLVFDIVA